MKRMVLIPEERLLRYEQRDKERVEDTNQLPERVMHCGGEETVRGIPINMKAGARTLLARLKEREDSDEEAQEDST